MGKGDGVGGGCKDVGVRKTAPLFSAVLATVLLVGCADEPVNTPTACTTGPEVLGEALERAPGPARLEGRIPISDCLVPNQPDGDLMDFGSSAVEVGTQLGRESRSPGPEGIAAAIRAGYLVGAMEKGSADTGGIHAVLIDRVRSAATNGITGTAKTHYEIGYEAGERLG